MNGTFYSDVAQRVSRTYETLSDGHRRIADFVLSNPTDAAQMNNIEIAAHCKVSAATATRFVRAVGFAGFSEFRESLIASLRGTASYAERLSGEIDLSASRYDMVRNGLDQDLRNLRSSYDTLDPSNCQRAVDMILNAERVFAFGGGLSQYVIGTLIHGLEPYCGGNASNIGPMSSSNSAIRKVVHCTHRDLLIVCALPHYAVETLEITRIARDKGASVIGITDRPTSPIIKYSDAIFYAETSRRLLPNSITSAVGIAEGLIAAVANCRKEGLEVHRTLDARHGL